MPLPHCRGDRVLDIAPLFRLQARGGIPIRDDTADSHMFSTGICKSRKMPDGRRVPKPPPHLRREIVLGHPRIFAQQIEASIAGFPVDLFVH